MNSPPEPTTSNPQPSNQAPNQTVSNQPVREGESSPTAQFQREASRIECHDVSVVFGGHVKACDRISMIAPAGKILTLVGPSGCGKTTLLRVMAGLQKPSSGSVTLEPATDRLHGGIGFVFQQPALLKWRTAIENVMLPLELAYRDRSRRQRREMALEMLGYVELSDAADRFPHQLSGGMQMRVSIARALVTRPTVLLLDEPFAALDDMLRHQLGELLLDLWNRCRFTTVLVTHNIFEAITMSHQIEVIRDGKTEASFDNPLPWPRNPSQHPSKEFGIMYGKISEALRGKTVELGESREKNC